MNSSDEWRVLLIFLIFIIIYLVIIFVVEYENIKKKWPQYKCNPIIMPFARVFGHDEFNNFTECIQIMQSDYMDYLLQPLHLDISIITQMGKLFSEGTLGAFSLITNIQGVLKKIFEQIYQLFSQIIIEIQKMTININDIFGKIGGMFILIKYIIEGIGLSMVSLEQSVVGDVIGLCFDPETKIRLYNGDLVAMKDLELNSKLKNGSRVMSVMKINNLKTDGSINNKLYKIDSGENNTPIYVTGSHLVYDETIKKFVKVENLSEKYEALITNKDCPVLSCLVTSDHTIPIGNMIFHDWEDNDGSLLNEI
tara:strand:+ start:117 stop:1043 length:927 start_codon:yes stop_codon:yes gene_type:complete